MVRVVRLLVSALRSAFRSQSDPSTYPRRRGSTAALITSLASIVEQRRNERVVTGEKVIRTGYWCADDHTCWQRDHRPGAHAADMGVADDMTTTGRDASTATGGDDMTTRQADMANAIMSCVDATDCPAPSRPCLVPACIHGACGNAVASAGTVLPAALQTPGDCQKLTCDGNGNATPTADTSDLPADPSGGCNTPHCNGSTVLADSFVRANRMRAGGISDPLARIDAALARAR